MVTRLEPDTVAKHFEKFHKVTQLQDASKLEPTQRFEDPDEAKLPCFGLLMCVTLSQFPPKIDIIFTWDGSMAGTSSPAAALKHAGDWIIANSKAEGEENIAEKEGIEDAVEVQRRRAVALPVQPVKCNHCGSIPDVSESSRQSSRQQEQTAPKGLSARLRVCVYVCLCLSLRRSLQLVIT